MYHKRLHKYLTIKYVLTNLNIFLKKPKIIKKKLNIHIKKYKDNLINQKKKRQQRKFNKRDYD
ncbi:hypothetical protein PFMALIP_03250 [Plasmodium falciparum MaliPS096_E11]|uniref:Uncharacterized protein n=1 Tax=Plasmodium falciparum MaliPS096_E11 TaxID=1036727 RepID=A0A024WNF4_PLAFA|nr:hypothetical protein PFMALIP_03250 [Plasmodium falciparum MaliPS096_E11]